METFTVEAIYKAAKLTPLSTLPFHEEERLVLKVVRHSNVENSQGLVYGFSWETIREIAENTSLPLSDFESLSSTSAASLWVCP